MNDKGLLTRIDIQETQKNAAQNLVAARDLINRSYLGDLGTYPVIASSTACRAFKVEGDVRIFQIERLAQDNKQSVLESTAAAYTALGAAGYAVFLFLSSNGTETNVYIGTRGELGRAAGQTAGELLNETFKGHFPGSSLQQLRSAATDELLGGLREVKGVQGASITAVTAVPALSTEDREQFMQGLERFIDAAEHREYQALILAEPLSSESLSSIKTGYEQTATQLMPLLKQQIAYGVQDSDTVGMSISQSLSTSLGESLGLTETRGSSHTTGTSTSETSGSSDSYSSQTAMSKVGSVLGGGAGAAAGALGGPMAAMVGAQIGSGIATALSGTNTTGTSNSTTRGTSESESSSHSESTAQTRSSTDTRGVTDTHSLNRTLGSNRQLSIEVVDKTIEQLLTKIDGNLQRVDEAKTYGGWNSAAYFIGDSRASSETLASIFLGLTRGNKSSHEDFALTTWESESKSKVIDWLLCFSHPELEPSFQSPIPVASVTPATLVSGKEMAIQLSLPRRSTSTVMVVKPQAFGRKVQSLDNGLKEVESSKEERTFVLGKIRHLWQDLPQNLELNLEHLASHTFITGSTGAGKSNALYGILDQVNKANVPFLVIEPAKGEYKHVFGHRKGVTVLGTNPAYSRLLKINPFQFPASIHVLEHVDRLVEIFNVCWPMYAAMPAVLKDAILLAYQNCGWDLDSSQNSYGEKLFPTFIDLLESVERIIEGSAYSQEVKGNYIGSLSTRIKSLTNGLNGQLFGAEETDNNLLFNTNVIVDLSRIGSVETKALIMGVLVMRLVEHRFDQGGMNESLKHVTVLEEAHNIFKNSSSAGGAEGADLVGKSVEMLTNAIAEMRTYGEGFIIADQSPHAVDISAIRNTNTKIILRLPDEADRRLVGKSISLRDEQLEEIAKLPKGVAIVYQNDWLEPVLCKIDKFSGEEKPYNYKPDKSEAVNRKDFHDNLLRLLLRSRVNASKQADIDLLQSCLYVFSMPTRARIALLKTIEELSSGDEPTLNQPSNFEIVAKLLVEVLGCREQVSSIIKEVQNFESLNQELDRMLKRVTNDTNEEMLLAAQQCLLKDYSLHHVNGLDVYSGWHAHNKGEGVK